jgi:hypothetical protein
MIRIRWEVQVPKALDAASTEFNFITDWRTRTYDKIVKPRSAPITAQPTIRWLILFIFLSSQAKLVTPRLEQRQCSIWFQDLWATNTGTETGPKNISECHAHSWFDHKFSNYWWILQWFANVYKPIDSHANEDTWLHSHKPMDGKHLGKALRDTDGLSIEPQDGQNQAW